MTLVIENDTLVKEVNEEVNPENENESEDTMNYIMIKDDEIHTHELVVSNGFTLVGDSIIAYLSESFLSYNMLSHGAKDLWELIQDFQTSIRY